MATPELLPEPKRLWLEGLRSEEFAQTKGALRDDEGYCCLGVLCEVAIKAGVIIEVSEPSPGDDGKWGFDGNTDLPPDSVIEWAFGISDVSLEVLVDSDEHDGVRYPHELTELNDTSGWTFEEIANAVEEQM